MNMYESPEEETTAWLCGKAPTTRGQGQGSLPAVLAECTSDFTHSGPSTTSLITAN